MQRTGILFVIVGGIVCAGVVLSFYGNQVIFEDLIKGEGQIKVGESLTIPAELNNTEPQNGIYAIQIMDSKGVKAKILDPFDVEIESQSISEEDFEGQFKIMTSGTYKLVIENISDKEVKIFGVIGPEPDAGKKSLGFISLYVLIIGLIGIVVVPIYAIKNRKRSFS